MAPIERKCQFGNGKAWKTAVCFGRVIIKQNVHEVAKRCYMAHIVNMDVNSRIGRRWEYIRCPQSN